MKRIIVLASGSGTNLQAIIDAAEANAFDGKVVGVISNVPEAKCLDRAAKHQIDSVCVDHKQFETREQFDAALSQAVDQFKPDIIVLAGFMRILTPVFVDRYLGKLINIHPSLLPKYPGLNTHQRALDAGDEVAGATVHFVTAELDGGPAIIQGQTKIEHNMDAGALAAKILHQVEHRIFPIAIEWLCDARLKFNAGVAYLDDNELSTTGVIWEPSDTP